MPSFSVLAAATFSPHTRETPDLLSCCKKLSSLDRPLRSSSRKRQKPMVCRKVRFKCHADIIQTLGYLKVSNDRTSQDLQKICGNLLYSFSFVGYGSVKILTSIFVQCLFV